MPKVNIDGIDIHYQRSGEGPDLVMVHGLAANLAFWYMRIVPLLAKNYCVTVYDLRGHGLSGMPINSYTTKDMANDLDGLLHKTKIKKHHLVGHSLGGAVCLHYTILHPEKVNSLSLIDCRIHALQPLRSPQESPYWINRRKELRDKGICLPDNTPKVVYSMLEELAPLVKSGIANPNAIPGILTSSGAWNPKSRAAQRWKKLVTTTTFTEDIRKTAGLTEKRIQKITHPTLLSYGGDSFCIDTCYTLRKLLVNHKTIIYPKRGHFFPVTEYNLFVQDLKKFLDNISYQKQEKVISKMKKYL